MVITQKCIAGDFPISQNINIDFFLNMSELVTKIDVDALANR